MATSGSTTVKITSLNSLIFQWERTSFSTADNTSTIKWELIIKASSGGRINSSASKDYTVIVNGKTYSGTNTIGVSSGESKVIASGTQTIEHNADGSKSFSYSFTQEIAIDFSGSKIGTKSGSGTGTLDLIARKAEITEAPNFNDEANPVIKYSNKAGNAVDALEACISLTGAADDVAYRAISKTGSSYTFNLTAAERKVLRQATDGKSRTVRFYVRTTINGVKYLSYVSKTLSIVNGNPAVSGTVIDTDAAVVALTGNNNIIVKGYSNANYSITATAKKEASISSYKVVCGDGKSATTKSGTLNNVGSAEFTFSATDSRGYTSSTTIRKTLINYIPLTANIKGNLSTDGVLTITASGNCFNSSFGAVRNTISLEYRFKQNGGDWGSWVNITPSLNDGATSYSVNKTISGLDYRNTYVLQTRAIDKLRNITSAEYTVISYPIFDWGEDNFNFNVPVGLNWNGYSYDLLGLFRAMTTTYTPECDVSPGENYSSATITAHLTGCNLRIGLSATRNEQINAGNFTNETVATVDINHGGKLANLYRVSFNTSTSGGVATLDCQASKVNDNVVRLTINLCAAAHNMTEFNAYFAMPCSIITKAYV